MLFLLEDGGRKERIYWNYILIKPWLNILPKIDFKS